jgi:hypothetical protein
MSRKNFKVATAEDGKTTLVKIDKTPTGKVKTIKDKETIRKEREEQYKNFRINALKRRAARMQMPKEQIDKAVEDLIAQLNTPNSYTVIIFFRKKDADIVRQSFLNEGLVWNIMSDSHLITVADQETLATIRSIMPPSAKIHPYVKKKPAILPATDTKSEKKPKKGGKPHSRLNGKKETRKRYNIARLNKKNKADFKKHIKYLKDRWKANKKKTGTTVQLNSKKGSNARKKASTNLKKAA